MTLINIGFGSPLGEIRLKSGDLCLDVYEHQVTIGENEVSLANDEYRCLMYLLRKRGEVVSREMLYNHLYLRAAHKPDPKIIDVYISKIRKKIAGVKPGVDYIHTIRCQGYRIPNDHHHSTL